LDLDAKGKVPSGTVATAKFRSSLVNFGGFNEAR
jgi:hypothetical protein